MKRMTVAALAAALTVGTASIALSQAGTGSNAPRTESARAADRNRDDGFNWGWLGLLGLGGLAGLMRRDRRRTDAHGYPTTSVDRTSVGTPPGSTTGRGF